MPEEITLTFKGKEIKLSPIQGIKFESVVPDSCMSKEQQFTFKTDKEPVEILWSYIKNGWLPLQNGYQIYFEKPADYYLAHLYKDGEEVRIGGIPVQWCTFESTLFGAIKTFCEW